MEKKNYDNYFKKHYKLTFSPQDLKKSSNWLYPQWSFISKKVSLSDKTHILEIGSGYGGFLNYLLPHIDKNKYVGLDLDSQVVKFTNKTFDMRSCKNTSIEEFNTNKKFDYIFAFEVLEHVENPLEVIKKIHKLLKPETGIFIGTSPYPYTKNVIADKTHMHVLHPKTWEKFFLLSKFTSVDTYPMTFIPYLWRISKFLNPRIPIYLPQKHIISTSLIIAKV